MRWLRRTVVFVLVMLLAIVCTAWWLLHSSLSRLDGEVALHGLGAQATLSADLQCYADRVLWLDDMGSSIDR